MNTRKILVVLSVLLLAVLCSFVAYHPPVIYEEPIYPGAPGDSWCNSDFAKRIDISVNNTGGSALTDYQVYVDLSLNPINETSIRVYNATSCALRPHWTENETSGDSYGVWINYLSIAASTWTNNTAIYYNNPSASSASDGSTTFEFFDDFDYTNWDKALGGTIFVEHSIIQNNKLYTPSDGIWVHELDGTELHHWSIGSTWCAPVVVGDYIYTWTYANPSYLHKTKESDGTDSSISGDYIDFEHLATANVSGLDLIFIPKGGYVTAIRTDTMAVYWTSSVAVSVSLHRWDGGLVLGNYLYTRSTGTGSDNKLYKLNLSDGTTVNSVDLESYMYYAHIVYDADNNQIILTEYSTNKVKAFNADNLTNNWNYTLEESTNWYLWYGPDYHDNKVFVANRYNPSGQQKSYIYCINATDGSKIWKSSVPYDNGVVVVNFLLDDTYLYCPTIDYIDGNYHKLLVIKISDGLLYDTINQSKNSACCAPVISNGMIYIGMYDDYKINARKLGNGSQIDCPFKVDSYLTGYIGERLTNYDPDKSTLADKWTTQNSALATVVDGICSIYYAGTDDWAGIIGDYNFGPYSYAFRQKVKYNTNRGCSGGAIDAWTNTGNYNDAIVLLEWNSVLYTRTINETVQETQSETSDLLNYHVDEMRWKSDEVKIERYNGFINTHSTEVPDSALYPFFGVRKYAGTGYIYVDWSLVRKYAATEPSATLGSEEDAPATTPSISNVQNGSISPTSQWIDWDVNQTAHNQVVYDKGYVGADSTACEGQWSSAHACANASDGNWSSYAESAGALLAYAYFNYTVPTGASQSESLWHVKDAIGHANLTIPSTCWGGTLYLRAMCSDIANSIAWQCDDGPSWTTLHTSVANIAYEQEMKFKYTSSWDNSTAAPNITLSGLSGNTLYEYQARSYNTTNTSLSDNSITLYFTTAAASNYITITGGNRALFCDWSANTTFANIAANLTNCTDFFYYNSTSQKWIFYNVTRTINANTAIHKHAAIFVCFNNTTTVECDILAAETITIPSNVWYYTALRESTSKTLTEINTAITADGCTISDLYAWNSAVGSYTNTGSYSVLPNEGFAIYATTGCPWDGSI